MELAFDSKLLRTICESEANAKRELGPMAAEGLKHRLADLCAATTIKDLVAGRPRLLDDVGRQCMVIDLCDGYQMVLCANHPNNPVTESGNLDWPRINRIKILWIGGNYV